jgi:hypothetical protein
MDADPFTERTEDTMESNDDTISHKQLYDKMVAHERRFNQILTFAASTMVPATIGAFIWIWSTHSAQAAFNAGIKVRVENAAATYVEARESQKRVESRLDEINRFLREDSRELRDELNAHIRSAENEQRRR